MRPRLVIIFLLIVVVPLLLLTGMGIHIALGEQERLKHRFQELLTGKLHDVDSALARYMEARQRELLDITQRTAFEPDFLRRLPEKHSWIRQAFLLDSDGKLLYPAPGAEINDAELNFLERTREIWVRGDLFSRSESPGVAKEKLPTSFTRSKSIASQIQIKRDASNKVPAIGWYAWYWGSGLNLIFWNSHADGNCLGVEIERMRLLADLIAQLPSTDSTGSDLSDGRITLTDSNGINLYQWGRYERSDNDQPVASLPLSVPLASWRLDYYTPAGLLASPKGGLLFQIIAGLIIIGAALVMLAVYFYRESSHEFREASERVSFVNQVSHELKTPLTNIRIYSELLQQRLAAEDNSPTRHLDVIVEEGERLSRLITNVLTFSSSRRGALTVHPAPTRVREIIQKVIDRFHPAFERHKIKIRSVSESDPLVYVAADALEQILGNLLSNIEKYAAKGQLAEISSRYDNGWTIITVTDRGPGIAAREHENIFKPFYRISSALSDGVTGAGIGLSIARDLARQHGGDLVFTPVESGSRFELRLRTEPVEFNQEAAT